MMCFCIGLSGAKEESDVAELDRMVRFSAVGS
jgi:hypothetical protein